MKMLFRWVQEDQPGERWKQLFAQTWASYRHWFLMEGDARRPAFEVCRVRLEEHMPELLDQWERLAELAGGNRQVARMLSLYRPTPYMAGCSQAVWLRGEPLLIRNYDYHPAACEGVFTLSNWNGTRVLSSSDCLWGALDGMNEHGLAVSLAFGGRRIVGDGFGIPLILRYVLETCHNTKEAVAALRRIPSNMAYNVSVLDETGEHKVVYLSPDRKPMVSSTMFATNHQKRVEWPDYDRRTRSAARGRYLAEQLQNPRLNAAAFTQLFLKPPLFAASYEQSFGTLYTAVYSPRSRKVAFLWRGTQVEQHIDEFREQNLVVPLVSVPVPEVG